MIKAELIDAIYQKGGFTSKAQAEQALNNIVSVFIDCLAKGDSFSLPDFGTFKVAERAARKGRNLKTGAEILIPASKIARFSPSKKLKEKVKG